MCVTFAKKQNVKAVMYSANVMAVEIFSVADAGNLFAVKNATRAKIVFASANFVDWK
jgi:hypothetical protein